MAEINVPKIETGLKEQEGVEELEQAREVLGHYFETKGISDYDIIDLKRTGKSVYGEVVIENKPYYFKVAKSEDLAIELSGYRTANAYPHEPIVDHFFDDEYGLMLQNYCEDLRPGGAGLLSNYLNKRIYSPEEANPAGWTGRARAIFENVQHIVGDTVTSPMVLSGPSDKFFAERLTPDGRISQFYAGQTMSFPAAHANVECNDLFGYQIHSGGDTTTITEQLEQARMILSPDQPRVFAVTQGDLTENNISANGVFFDFETAGLNSILQEAAIFIYFAFIYGHYLGVKYSDFPSTNLEYDANQLLNTEYQLDRDDRSIKIDCEYTLPEIKRELIRMFNETVVVPLEKSGKLGRREDIEYLKSAFLMRIIGVKNLRKFAEKDMVFSLSLVPYLCDRRPYSSVSDYINDKFINWGENER